MVRPSRSSQTARPSSRSAPMASRFSAECAVRRACHCRPSLLRKSQGSFKDHMAARSPAHSHTLHTMHMHHILYETQTAFLCPSQSQARFDPADGEANVNKIIKALPATFTAAHIASWAAFFSAYPAAVEDILEERLLPVRTDALPPCSTQLALSSLARHQVRYAQTKHLCMHAHVCTLW